MKQENKKHALICLERAVKAYSREEIQKMQLSEDEETVTVIYLSGTIIQVNVACDSVVAMIKDVAASLLG